MKKLGNLNTITFPTEIWKAKLENFEIFGNYKIPKVAAGTQIRSEFVYETEKKIENITFSIYIWAQPIYDGIPL